MSEDTYTPGDPIFEHGGESELSEQEFEIRSGTDAEVTEGLNMASFFCRELIASQKLDPEDEAEWATCAFKCARELERRRLGNGRDI